ncbi:MULTISPECIES: metal ABC transporter solute-binding protein, Zn/Mn family [Prauserella salsuginis group]|uniref:Metal ABC transporter solute-binding protein, Zn/Mn family n=1 Tax=Prauserella salsuginis TaxID=387889 RepID=A0ABW6G710_9PSEU|nr:MULTISPECIES: zinc ABC transporter substrate-binding protein [Prauserella salsuginis group]MCR3720833.1 zinc/manganese transport system substrate-binding protein [Prauserella flava]MCR3735086.1 zinc/manganese transport system substrate-binding protein [Prauserella salsuginis]
MNKARAFTAVPMAAALIAATACGGSEDGSGDDSAITVVASTNVWGSVVKAVGGEHVEVKSLIDDPSGDPHSYEATAEDAADVQDGELLVYNGGGYDDFFTQLAEQSTSKRFVVAVEDDGGDQHGHGEDGHGGESGPDGLRSQQGDDHDDHDHGTDDGHGDDQGGQDEGHGEQGEGAEDGHDDEGHGDDHGEGNSDEGNSDESGHEGHSHGDGDNEHVWYDPEVVGEVADDVAAELAEIDPGQKQTFTDNAAAFKKRLDGMEQQIADIPDGRVLATAPVAHYLLEGAGLEDVTPQDYTRAIENETDVPVAAQQRVTNLVKNGEIDAVVNNPQTVTSVTEKLTSEAEGANVPVVDMTETLPEGQDDYIAWMTGQIEELAGALGQ